MPRLSVSQPVTPAEVVTDLIHGVPVTDPYRWLEDGDSTQTREWLERQREYTRAYLDHLPGRDLIRKRIREFLAVETYDSVQTVGTRHVFRKRLPNQEQPSIYMREGLQGDDQLLVDPVECGAIHTRR
jgi:prolyl oligopeptidase